MTKTFKLSLAALLAASSFAVFALPAPGDCPNGNPMGPRAHQAYALNADNFAPGPHHTAHLRPVRGHGMANVMNTYCPHHNTLLGDCLGEEFEKEFKADYDNLQNLKDQLFIKKQILKARVNDGDDASAISKYAKDVNYARKAVRDARYHLQLKLRSYVQQHFDATK